MSEQTAASASPVRVRFAPSPTGYLHIGGARTALFNWLYARHTGGTFVLRIEDTDAARNTQEAVDVILNGLRWLGLEWDEGPLTGDADGPSKGACGPYFQSRRGDIYKRRVNELLASGKAYEDAGAIRFRMEREAIVIPDLIKGDIRRELIEAKKADDTGPSEAENPDFVIVRSDGQPVFHLVNVIDDLEMRITHVIRGEDHLSNTAKHLALFRAFGAEPPKYAHIPLILNPGGSKMSKRDVGASLTTYSIDGFPPEAVVNYLCLLGWSPKGDREILPLSEVAAMFDLPQVLRHNAKFDLPKLQWFSGEYIRAMTPARFKELALEALHRGGIGLSKFPEPYIDAALATCKEKIKQFSDLPAYAGFYFKDQIEIDDAGRAEFTAEAKQRLQILKDAYAAAPEFNAQTAQEILKATAKNLGVKAGALVHPVRMATTGAAIGPSLYDLLAIIGREKMLERLQKAIEL